MGSLSRFHCVACSGEEPALDEAQIEAYQPEVPGWELIEIDGVKRLRRQFRFPDFAAALRFTQQVGELAEEEGHHPALLTEWGRVTVSWWTHKIKGLHRNDFIMASKTSDLAETATSSS